VTGLSLPDTEVIAAITAATICYGNFGGFVRAVVGFSASRYRFLGVIVAHCRCWCIVCG